MTTNVREITDAKNPSRPVSNALTLKWLRNRARFSLAECAEAIGTHWQTDYAVTAYARYENDRKFDAAPIPARVILPLIPLLVGQGRTPIKLEELLEISELACVKTLELRGQQ
jgi:transcriptional regulator with XRE-family HTH domain